MFMPLLHPPQVRALARLHQRHVWARIAMVLAALSLTAGCSASNADPSISATREASPSTVTAAPVIETTTTTAPTEVVPDVRPLAPHEVLVAEVRPEIAQLTTYDSPDGNQFTPELAQVNPWYFGGALTLLVVGGLESDPWLEVALPSRPNGVTAWIHASDVTLRRHTFHITVSVGERVLRAYEADTLVLETPIVVGRPNTPTPLGHFYINAEIPQGNAGGAYGPMILSVSAFSEVLNSFDGGLPEIGLHGTNQPGLVGTASSNGCIRMPNDAITKLEALVPVGPRVDFVA
jgi:lipoprotein-anchoring transpeptidase ErfK/SrfK